MKSWWGRARAQWKPLLQKRFWMIFAGVGVAAVAVCIPLLVSSKVLDQKDVASGAFALLGTFIGAFLAFRLEVVRERAKEIAAQKVALNRALMVLGYHHNFIQNYLALLEPHQSEIELAFNLPASEPSDQMIRQQVDELDFLLETESPQMLFDLILEQERFDQVLKSINRRNAFYVDRVQPELARLEINGRAVTRDELEDGLGELVFGGAMQGAETLKHHVVASSHSIPDLAEKFRALAKQLYPDEKFVKFQTIANWKDAA